MKSSSYNRSTNKIWQQCSRECLSEGLWDYSSRNQYSQGEDIAKTTKDFITCLPITQKWSLLKILWTTPENYSHISKAISTFTSVRRRCWSVATSSAILNSEVRGGTFSTYVLFRSILAVTLELVNDLAPFQIYLGRINIVVCTRSHPFFSALVSIMILRPRFYFLAQVRYVAKNG